MPFHDLTKLAEPVSKLIDAFSKATATLYEPRRIQREALAKANALLIGAQAEVQADELRQRAVQRFIADLLQKEQNLQDILSRTESLLVGPDPTTEMDSDWIRRFASEAEDVSDDRLRELWARMLAGEFQCPGTFPRRLLRLLKDIDPKDAQSIEAVAPRVLHVEDHDENASLFFFSRIVEKWWIGSNGEETNLLDATFPAERLLRELGLIEPDSFLFEFSVSGSLEPDKIQLSPHSARRVFTANENLIPKANQPNFLRRDGPRTTSDGRPRINVSTKSIAFHGWKVTQLGESMFTLAATSPDPTHFAAMREAVLKSGLMPWNPE